MVRLIAQDVERIREEARIITESQFAEIDQLVRKFLLQPITPEATWQFENAVEDRLREFGRNLLEEVCNRLEADDPAEMPEQVEFDRQEYSRKNEKSTNRGDIGTVSGEIRLIRFSYEPPSEARDDKQKSVSPLEFCLGIVAGNTTPALAERVGRAAADQTQRALLEFLERGHRVRWSAKVLRQVTAAVSNGVAEHLHQAQKEQLLALLRAADGSKGRHMTTLAVGRDGGHRPQVGRLPIRGEKTYKEGAVGTGRCHFDKHRWSR